MPKPAEALVLVRRICLALPGVVEKAAWGAPTFRTPKRMFAMFVEDHDDGRLAVCCDAPPDAQRLAVNDDPKNFFVPPHVGRSGWVGIRLDRGLSWKRVETLLGESFRWASGREARKS